MDAVLSQVRHASDAVTDAMTTLLNTADLMINLDDVREYLDAFVEVQDRLAEIHENIGADYPPDTEDTGPYVAHAVEE